MSKVKTTFFVQVVDRKTNRVENSIDCGSDEKKASKVDDGVNINLDHDRYYTKVVKKKKQGGAA